MFAQKHAVFVGPGRLPEELRDVLAQREGQPQPAVTIQAPRLLATFDTAADAERVAGQLQRLKLGALVAGPEQPPVEDAWWVATHLEEIADEWRARNAAGDEVKLAPSRFTAVTVLDWRDANQQPDRAVLVHTPDLDRPLLVRAKRIDPMSDLAMPTEGLQKTAALVDTIALELPEDTRVRVRRLAETDFHGGVLEGDLVPVALAMVHELDTHVGALSKPVGRTTSGSKLPRLGLREMPSLRPVAWWTWTNAAITGALGAFLLIYGGWRLFSDWELTPALVGLTLTALGSIRLSWARSLAHKAWSGPIPVPTWPLAGDTDGPPPTWSWLVLEPIAGLLALSQLRAGGLTGALMIATLGATALSFPLSVWALRASLRDDE